MLAGSATAVTWLTSFCRPSTVAIGPRAGSMFCTLGVPPVPVNRFGRKTAEVNVVTAGLSKPPRAGWLLGEPQPAPLFDPKLASLPFTCKAFELGAPKVGVGPSK